ATWAQDPQRTLSFDGVDDKVTVGNLGPRPTQGTIEFWLNSSDVQDYRNPFATNDGNIGIRFEQSSSGDSFVVVMGDDTGNYSVHTYRPQSNPLSPGIWYHVALVWDSSQNKVWGYLNGKAMFSGEAQTLWSTTFNDVKFGSGLSISPNRWFKGNMKDIRIWNVARSQNQIIAGMNEISSNESGLAGRWMLNEGFGTTVYDLTNNRKDGTVMGATWQPLY
ncbi:LamG domain-containing protein, partial [Paenibacillus athensensis]|uniref:LamG domain-containing protein n=1 Tax=Paenibacillus athensensis TaxID=1967502 RepID=UPI001E399507